MASFPEVALRVRFWRQQFINWGAYNAELSKTVFHLHPCFILYLLNVVFVILLFSVFGCAVYNDQTEDKPKVGEPRHLTPYGVADDLTRSLAIYRHAARTKSSAYAVQCYTCVRIILLIISAERTRRPCQSASDSQSLGQRI